jgi:hypothetical protein
MSTRSKRRSWWYGPLATVLLILGVTAGSRAVADHLSAAHQRENAIEKKVDALLARMRLA